MRRATLPTIVLAAALALSACASKPNTVEVTVTLSTCLSNGAQCFGLPLPDAMVVLTRGDGKQVAKATTDDHGFASMSPASAGSVHVIVTSPLIEGGHAESDGVVPSGDTLSITITANISPDAKPPF
jgi:hypothetical protein